VNILASGVGKRNALLRLISNECATNGMALHGADAAEFPPARVDTSAFHRLPVSDSPTFRAEYAELLRNQKIAAHLTLIDPEIPVLAQLDEAKQTPGSMFVQTAQSSAVACEDKYAFFCRMNEYGVPTIETTLEPLHQTPFIRKDRRGSASSGFQVFETSASKIDDERPGDYIYQPFCFGDHHCIDAYFSLFSNNLVDICVKRVIHKSRGESYVLESVAPTRFIEMVRSIADALPLRGIVNIDVFDENGVLRVMEVNCRIGGNYPATQKFGCNLLAPMFREILQKSEAPFAPTNYDDGQMVVKYFDFSEPLAHGPGGFRR
jgi:carbamoyl-phosphate synthase large subunit